MNFGTERYYQSSGSAPIVGILLALAIGTLGASFVGVIYAFIDWYNPFIYVTFLATCGFALGAGFFALMGVTIGKIRNRAVSTLVAVISGLLGLWVSWVTFIWILGDYPPVSNMMGFFNPSQFFLFLQVVGQEGLWEIKGGTPTGWGLYTFWLIEAAIVVLGSGLMGLSHDSPFCERCNCWTDEKTCDAKIPLIEDMAGLKIDLENEMYDKVTELATQPAAPEAHLQVKIHKCPSCENSTWTTIEQVVTTVNDKGESNTSTEKFIRSLSVPRETAEHLLALPANDSPMAALSGLSDAAAAHAEKIDEEKAEEAEA